MFNIKTQSLFTTSNTPVTRSTYFDKSTFTGNLSVPTKQVDPALMSRGGTAKMFMGSSANKFSSMDYQS